MRVFELPKGFARWRGGGGFAASVTASGFGGGSRRSRDATAFSSAGVGSVTVNSTRDIPSRATSASVITP